MDFGEKFQMHIAPASSSLPPLALPDSSPPTSKDVSFHEPVERSQVDGGKRRAGVDIGNNEGVGDGMGTGTGSGADSDLRSIGVDSGLIDGPRERKVGGSSVLFENLVWLSSAEAASYLRKSYGALRVMVCRGYLRPRVFKRRWYFRRTELDRVLEGSI